MNRLGAVSYLNTKPLIQGLRERLDDVGNWSLHFDLPSRLAGELWRGDLDVGLIPAFEYFRMDGARILSDACIGCKGPVRSVKVLFNRPPQDVQTLALDEGSRTSAALAQILLRKRYGLEPSIEELPIQADFRDCNSDAVLVIGDRAMNVPDDDFELVWDLGEVWLQTTGLPFVFAMWVMRSNLPVPEPEIAALEAALQASRNEGLELADKLAERFHGDYAITHVDCSRYFTDQLHFTLGERELAGLYLFRQLAIEYNLLPTNTETPTLQTS